MTELLSAMGIFVEYPLLAAVLGVAVLALGVRTRRRIATGVGIVWLLYALYETAMKRRWLCTGECDIRIDLLIIYPVLLIGFAAAVVSLLRASRIPRARS